VRLDTWPEAGSWLLTGAAERRSDAITHAADTPEALGARLMPCQRASEPGARARALHAEARQILGPRRAERPIVVDVRGKLGGSSVV
jgi:hypothetical protein